MAADQTKHPAKRIPYKNRMFETPESANQWFDIFNLGLAIGAFLVAICTWGTFKTGAVKEKFSDERISSNEAATKRAIAESDKANAALGVAQADIAKANAKIAESEARQKEAELRLEQLRERMRPRNIKGEQFLEILKDKPKAPVAILFVRDDPDCFQLSMQIRDFLKQANWDVAEPRAIEVSDMTPRLAQYTSTMGVGGQPQGLTVVMRATSQADFDREREGNPFHANEPIDTPRKALTRALGDSLGSISGGISYDSGVPGVLLVVVGPKPNLN
jgi:hypothetical protein